MPFKISKIKGEPVYDTLPVAQLLHYPLEKRDYKPYVQVRGCQNEKSFYLHMLAFEAIPAKDSTLAAALTLPGQTGYFWLSARPNGTHVVAELRTEDGSATPIEVQAHPISGEDLQGIYWGIEFILPLSLFKHHFGTADYPHLLGNLYKLSEDALRPHKGSFFPGAFTKEPFCTPADFGEIPLIDF